MAVPKELLKKDKGLDQWNIILAYRGSIAHGMYVPDTDPNSVDDKDLIGICIPPLEYYFGLPENKFKDYYKSGGTQEIVFHEWDVVIYEWNKLIRLLLKGNPNVLSLLWLEEKHYINLHPIGRELIERRDLFVSKDAYYSFVGYAKGQLHRMTHGAYRGRMGEKRKGLVDKYGYDTKNASHLIRLLRMGIEFLNDGELIVERKHDASELLDIKKGKWKLEKVKQEADRLFDLADRAYISSNLPRYPDRDRIEELSVSLLKQFLLRGRL